MKRINDMRRASVKEIQQVLLEMMKDIHAFCIENDIKYSLAYGTLIGAIRHKGFIPWDDDIDIWMPRSDYEKFVNSYRSHDGYMIKSPNDKGSYMGYARVYEFRKTFTPYNYRGLKESGGVWIDVFPIDGVSNDDNKRSNDFSEFCGIRNYTSGFRIDMYHIRTGGGISRLHHAIRLVARRIISGSINSLFLKMSEICKRNKFGKTIYCSNYYCYEAYLKRRMEVLRTDWFQNFILIQYEDTEFMISDQYDAILSSIYGNYMIIPPKEKRVGFHAATFYWK